MRAGPFNKDMTVYDRDPDAFFMLDLQSYDTEDIRKDTHINFTSALLNPDSCRVPRIDGNIAFLYQRVTALKSRKPDLEI